MIAETPNKTWDYILKEERDKDESEQTVFKLKALSAEEHFAIQNLTWQEGEGIGTGNMSTLVAGLVGWQNLKDESGNQVSFNLKDGVCAPENLNRLTPKVMRELIEAIRDRNHVTEEEEKNLSSEGD